MHSVIAKVDDDNPSVRGKADAAGSVQLAGSLARLPDLPEEVAVTLKHLDAVVAGVRHYYATFVVTDYSLENRRQCTKISFLISQFLNCSLT